MIRYELDDFNMTKISIINNEINSEETGLNYQCFGLKFGSERPMVKIIQDFRDRPDCDTLDSLSEWLGKSHISMTHQCNEDGGNQVLIGLRKDVRADAKFAAALVRTIVLFLEDRVRLTKRFRIPGGRHRKKANREGKAIADV